VLGTGVAALALLVMVAAAVRRSSSSLEPSVPAAKPAAPVFHEALEGRSYRNSDLRLSVSAPEGWSGSLGNRSQDRSPYEGLVVKMTPTADAPPSPGALQPFVTVVKRTLPPSTPRDPLAYIAREVLTPEKTVTDPPVVVTLSGRRVGKVGFEVRSGSGALRVLQVVYLTPEQAIVVTATAPAGAFAGWREKFEQVFESLKLES
jgi:hypothetical protein